MATHVELTNLTRGWLHIGKFYKIAPQKALTIAMTQVLRDEELAALVYRFASEGKQSPSKSRPFQFTIMRDVCMLNLVG